MRDGHARSLIKMSRWKETNHVSPHSYIRRWDVPKRDFEAFVIKIRNEGVVEYFGGRPYTYLYLDGYKYWTMGAPLEETIIINRAVVPPKEESQDG